MVTIRIRSWRPAMPSISGPRSTVASNFTVTPFVSGATCSLLIVLSSRYFHGPTCYYSDHVKASNHRASCCSKYSTDLGEQGNALLNLAADHSAETEQQCHSFGLAGDGNSENWISRIPFCLARS